MTITKKSRAAQLIIAAAIMVVVVIGVQYYVSVKLATENARALMDSELTTASYGVRDKLMHTQIKLANVIDSVKAHLAHPDSLPSITSNALRDYDFIEGVAVSFEPYYYKQYGKWHEVHSYRHGDSIVTVQRGGPHHDYLNMEWYREAATRGRRGYWSDPYVDSVYEGKMVMTFSRQLKAVNGEVVGCVDADVLLDSISTMLDSIKPFPNSQCMLTELDGTPLASSHHAMKPLPMDIVGCKQIDNRDIMLVMSTPRFDVYRNAIRLNGLLLVLLLLGLAGLAYAIKQSIEGLRRLDAVRLQQQTLGHELTIAHGIQQDIVRTDFPSDAAYELGAILRPMKDVGGDLYDYYRRGDSVFFIIGDVAGKGIPASLFMSAAVNLFRSAARQCDTPKQIIEQINQILSENNPSLTFVTAIVGKYNKRLGLLTYCNAGHTPPVVIDAEGNCSLLTGMEPNVPIGYDAGYNYVQQGLMLPCGNALMLYTDGVTDTKNSAGRRMGMAAMLDIVRRHAGEDMATLPASIYGDCEAYSEGEEQADDITVLCIKSLAEPQKPTITIANEIEELARVKSLLGDYCLCAGVSRALSRKITLGMEEALANVINYAYPRGEYGSIDIDIDATPSELSIVIADDGEPFDPTQASPVDVDKVLSNRQVGGLGIYLFSQIMDTVHYERTDDGRNVLTLKKILS